MLRRVHFVPATVYKLMCMHRHPFSEVVVQSLSCVRLFATPWTEVYQVPLSMGFPRQEVGWNWLPFPFPGDLPDPGIEPCPCIAGRFSTTEPSGLKSGCISSPLICFMANRCHHLDPNHPLADFFGILTHVLLSQYLIGLWKAYICFQKMVNNQLYQG